MSDDSITLEEVSKRTGIEPRTLRSWVSAGLLAPPLKSGRGARYPANNADRALAVRVLKDLQGLSLSAIRRRFMMATDEQIKEWAIAAGPTLAPLGSARDYLNKVRTDSEKVKTASRSNEVYDLSSIDLIEPLTHFNSTVKESIGFTGPTMRQVEMAGIERLIFQLEQVLGDSAPRRSRGAVWTKIAVTPDLELSVRGDLSPRERILFEQLADQFRAILTGRNLYEQSEND